MTNNPRIIYKTSPAFPTFGSVNGIVHVWSDHSNKTLIFRSTLVFMALRFVTLTTSTMNVWWCHKLHVQQNVQLCLL